MTIRSHPIHHARRVRWYDDLLPLAFLACLLAVAVNLVIPLVTGKLDDWRYGRPRTMHLSGVVGHEDSAASPTQFVAMNANRQIIVIEIPGGDVAKTRTLTGPYLFGAGEDLTPVRLELATVNADTLQDLVVSIKDEEIIYINEQGTFRLLTDVERAAMEGK